MPKKDGKRIEDTQKIIVPKGTINPTNDAVIEIPKRFQKQQIVIAQKAGNVSVPVITEVSRSCLESCNGVKKENVNLPNNQANHAVDEPIVIYVQKRIQTADPQEKEQYEYLEPLETIIRKVMVDRANSIHSYSKINIPDDNLPPNFSRDPHYDKLLVGELPSSHGGKARYVLLQEPLRMPYRKKSSTKNTCSKKCDHDIPLWDSDSEEEICPACRSSRRANCDACCSKKAIRDKYNLQRAMEKIPPKPSKIIDCVSIEDLSDTPCTPCREARSKIVLPGRSGSVLTDSDFENIKNQLREARKKLDEAVALVGKTTSSNVASSANYHDAKTCPLSKMVNQMRTEDIRPTSTHDNVLCLNSCSNTSQPPCTLEEKIRKNADELQQALRKLSNDVKKSSIPCDPIFPCEIPSVLSKQDMFRPPYESTKSLPTSAMKLGENRQKNHICPLVQARKKNEGGRKCIAVQIKPSDIEEVLCSKVCSNIDPPACQSEENLNKAIKPLSKQLSLPEKSSSSTMPCTRIFPCEIPSAILNQNTTKSVRSTPTIDTNEQLKKYFLKQDGGTAKQSKTDQGKGFVFKVSTQSQTMKTISLSKPNFDDEDSALEYIINALRTASDPEDDTPKTSTVTFKDNKK